MNLSVQWILSKLGGDKIMWLVVFCLSLFSILAVYSSTGTLAYKYQSGNTEYYLLKHFSILLLGFILMYIAHIFNYKYYSKISIVLLYISIPLLIITLFAGTNINQANRWLTLPIINLTFQTSDLAKLSLIMYTARFLSRRQQDIKDFRKTFLPVLVPIVIVCLIIAPADFSSSAMLFFTCFLLLFIGRVNLKYLGLLVGGGIVGILLMFTLLFALPDNMMVGRMSTWKKRVENFANSDKSETPYQVKQAKIAIAKGGVFKIDPGSSVQRNYLPHPYSDFIYAIIIEEYGLIGGFFIVFLYILFLYRSIRIVAKSPKAFGALLAVGLSISLVIQAMINMAVTVNLLPVTGLTLPMVSMGGSSLWFTSIAIGIILSVSRDIEKNAEKEALA